MFLQHVTDRVDLWLPKQWPTYNSQTFPISGEYSQKRTTQHDWKTGALKQTSKPLLAYKHLSLPSRRPREFKRNSPKERR